MKHQQDSPLRLGLEIDEEITACHQVQARKRRIDQQVMYPENDTLAHFRRYLVVVILFDFLEVASQVLRPHLMRYANRVEFIPVRSIREMRGFLRGMDTTITREDDRL